MAAPIGREVGIVLETTMRLVPGDYLISEATGRTWLITTVRTVQRGPNAGARQRVRAVVVPRDHPQPGDRCVIFAWNPRRRRAHR